MIFVTVGTQKFQFDRLLKYIDDLIEDGTIQTSVFAQVGYSEYKPKNYKICDFLNPKSFDECLKEADFVITHGGIGSIINSVKIDKKIIVIPRDAKYGEHIDNHQFEIAQKYKEKGYILVAYEEKDLKECIKSIGSFRPVKINLHSSDKISNYIINFLESN